MINNLQNQEMSNQQKQPGGGRNRGWRNNNSNNNSKKNSQQGFGLFQMPPAPTTWQPPMQKIPNTGLYRKTGNTPANVWNNGGQHNNNGGNNNNQTRFGAQEQKPKQAQWKDQTQGTQQAMMWNGVPFQKQFQKHFQLQQSNKPRSHNGYYCWYHGHRFSNNHMSMTCTNPVQGHQYMATRQNTMEGNAMGS